MLVLELVPAAILIKEPTLPAWPVATPRYLRRRGLRSRGERLVVYTDQQGTCYIPIM